MKKLELCFNATMNMEDAKAFPDSTVFGDGAPVREGEVTVDNGGATKYGVSLRGCRDEIGDKDGDGDVDAADVALLTVEDALKIFRTKYFNPVSGDRLPAPIALLAADFAYHGGPVVKKLQEVLGVDVDGKIGPVTLKRVSEENLEVLVDAYAGARLNWLKSLDSWPALAEGWTNRVKKAKFWAMRALHEDQ